MAGPVVICYTVWRYARHHVWRGHAVGHGHIHHAWHGGWAAKVVCFVVGAAALGGGAGYLAHQMMTPPEEETISPSAEQEAGAGSSLPFEQGAALANLAFASTASTQPRPVPVPEPGSWLVLIVGIAAVVVARRGLR